MLRRRRPLLPPRSCEPSIDVGGFGERCCCCCVLDFGANAGAGAASGGEVTSGALPEGAEAAEVGGGIGACPGCGGGGLRRCCAEAELVVRVGSAPVVAAVAIGSASVSVSLPVGSGEVWRVSVWGDCLSFVELELSAALAAWTSRANQLMLYQRPAQRTERMAKWMEEVVKRRTRRRSCRVPKVALVARRRVGVVPGVKTDSQRSVRKVAMVSYGGGVPVGHLGSHTSIGRGEELVEACESQTSVGTGRQLQWMMLIVAAPQFRRWRRRSLLCPYCEWRVAATGQR
jgi:hypothetical protein